MQAFARNIPVDAMQPMCLVARMKRLTEKQVIARIRAACKAAGSNRAFAEICGISTTYLQYVLAGERPPTEAVLAPIHIQRTTEYREIVK